ncbi:MAG TPA: hypothetical protein VF017_01620 [Thermoanaerobaculia bacterium]|nr:hypothetical protein [Thermoanaerobaculia bacterium]
MRFAGPTKATVEIPAELYRLVKAKTALEGRAVREVTVELFRSYVERAGGGSEGPPLEPVEALMAGRPLPPWYGILGKQGRRGVLHDLAGIRESVARGSARERDL